MNGLKELLPWAAGCGLLLLFGTAKADQIVKPHTFLAGKPAQAEQVNADFDVVYGQVNKVGAGITVEQATGNVGIGTVTPTAKLDVLASPLNTYGSWQPYSAYYNPCEHCVDTCDGNHTTEYTCRTGQRTCEDIRNSDGEDWEYRSVSCNQVQTAAQFSGNVRITGGILTGDGSGLTNISVCRDGDYINCYEGTPGTRGVGLCAGGVRTCSNLEFGVCEGQTLPTVEICNGLDDNCNEVVDDGLDGALGCTQYYIDQDADGAGDENDSGVCFCPLQPPAGYVSNNDDCRDNHAGVKPGAVFHDTPITGIPIIGTDWDWNCDGTWEKEYPSVWVSCPDGVYGCASGGWVGQVPACGQSAEFQPCGGYWNSGSGWICYETATVQQTQQCR